jgi:UDP-2-acetamido-2-deoxy-ribo-hexuluronate aminotransferase
VCDMDEINDIAARHGNLAVIEDAAQSFGATYKGRKSCNLSTLGCTSFFPSKPLGCYGDGGAVFTNDDSLATALREIRIHGQERRYHHTRVGVGGRMDTLQCAIVLGKLKRFDWEVSQREKLGYAYSHSLVDTGALIGLVKLHPYRTNVWAQYTVFVESRDSVQAKLTAAGIPTAVHYPIPLNLQPAYARYCCPDCMPNSTWASEHVMSLPMSADLSMSAMAAVVDALKSAVDTMA